MILRRIIKRVQEQNWTAIDIDFMIVDSQVCNWKNTA